MEIKIDIPGIKEIRARLENIGVSSDKILRKALSRSTNELRRELVDRVTSRFTVRPSAVRHSVSAWMSGYGANIRVSGKNLLATEFSVRPKRPVKHPHGLAVEVKRGNVESYPHGFVMHKRLMPFSRVGRGRYNFAAIYGPGIPILAGGSVAEALIASAERKVVEKYMAEAGKLLR